MSRRKPHDPAPLDPAPSLAGVSNARRVPPPAPGPRVGSQTLGRFELIRLLERRPFGVTRYQARDHYLDRPVILTICPNALPAARLDALLRAGTSTGDVSLDRFLYEARLLARLHHPAIPPVHELGLVEGRPYMIGRFAEGRSLFPPIEDGTPTGTEAARLLAELAEALHYVHEQGVVHRHVHPGIIRNDEQGRPHLTDFGRARLLAGGAPRPDEEEVRGETAYLSPEVIRLEGGRVDGRCDVYSLGVVLYRSLTGRLPFPGRSASSADRHPPEGEPEPPPAIDRRVDGELGAICLKAMAHDPEGRHPTAAALAEDLRRYLARSRPPGRMALWLARRWPWSGRRTLEGSTFPARRNRS